jgi:hypothetical protein
MDTTNRVEKFEDVLMFDPTKKSNSIQSVMKAAEQLNFYTQVYPEHIMEDYEYHARVNGAIKPPKCIFLPTKDLIRKMIDTNLKFA